MDDDPDDCDRGRVVVTLTMDVQTYQKLREQLDALAIDPDVNVQVWRD